MRESIPLDTPRRPSRLGDRLSTLIQTPWLRLVLVAGLVVLYAGWTGYIIYRNKPVDFYVYYSGGLAVRQGKNIFELGPQEWIDLGGFPGIPDQDVPYPHRYPPFYHVLMVPLTILPPRLAALVWASASGAALIASAWLLSRAFPAPGSAVALFVLLGASVPALATMHVGQVVPFVLLCLALALYAYDRKRLVWCGLSLGVSVLLKVIPIALVAYVFWRRQFKVGVIALLLVVLVSLVSLPLVGVDDYLSFVRLYPELTRADRLTMNPPNQSLGGLIGRFSAHLPGEPALYLRVIRVVSLCFIVVTVLLCWPPGDRPRRLPLEFGLIVAVLQLITPFAWLHQLTLLLVPLGALVYRLLTEERERWLAVPILLAWALIDVQGLFWHQLQAWRPYSLSVSLGTFGTLIIWGTLTYVLVQARKPSVSLASSLGEHTAAGS